MALPVLITPISWRGCMNITKYHWFYSCQLCYCGLVAMLLVKLWEMWKSSQWDGVFDGLKHLQADFLLWHLLQKELWKQDNSALVLWCTIHLPLATLVKYCCRNIGSRPELSPELDSSLARMMQLSRSLFTAMASDFKASSVHCLFIVESRSFHAAGETGENWTNVFWLLYLLPVLWRSEINAATAELF